MGPIRNICGMSMLKMMEFVFGLNLIIRNLNLLFILIILQKLTILERNIERCWYALQRKVLIL